MISIIVPTLDEEDYIGNLLNSLQRQIYRDFEVIIVDSSENDKTKKAALKFTRKLKIQFYSTHRKNASHQKNVGAKKAKGNILLFMDADITIPRKNFLKKVHIKFKNKNIAGATTKIKVTPLEEELQDVFFHTLFNTKIMLINKLNIGFARGGCQIVRKMAFEKVKGFNEKIVVSEDFELHRKIAWQGGLYFFNNLTVYESARRYRKYGYLKLIWLWTINGLFGIFTRSSIIKKWEPVR